MHARHGWQCAPASGMQPAALSDGTDQGRAMQGGRRRMLALTLTTAPTSVPAPKRFHVRGAPVCRTMPPGAF
jgi:hypothetical protein